MYRSERDATESSLVQFSLLFSACFSICLLRANRVLEPLFTARKSEDERDLSPHNEKRHSFNQWLPWLEIERGKIEIRSEGWESCRGEGGTCGSVI